MSDYSNFITALAHTSRALTTAFDNYLKDSGITVARGRVLLFLLKLPQGASQAEVTKHLRVEHPTAVRILDGLESQSLIKRLPSEADRRAKVIVLTEQGRTVGEEIAAASEVFLERILVGMSKDELELGTKLLGRVLANIEALSEAKDGNEP